MKIDIKTEMKNMNHKDKKKQNLVANLLELILIKKTLTFLRLKIKYLDT